MPKPHLVELLVMGPEEKDAARAYSSTWDAADKVHPRTIKGLEVQAFLAGILWERSRLARPPEEPLDVKAALALIAKELGL